MRVIITREIYQNARFCKKHSNSRIQKYRPIAASEKAARAGAPKTRKKITPAKNTASTAVTAPKIHKTITPAKNTASTIILAKKLTLPILRQGNQKTENVFARRRRAPARLITLKIGALVLSRSYQALPLTTITPLPNTLKYGSPLVRCRPIAAPRATARP